MAARLGVTRTDRYNGLAELELIDKYQRILFDFKL